MNTARIEGFTGEYRWLSNFAPASVELDGVVYPTVEHAYQAAKTLDRAERLLIRTASTAGQAKKLGRRVKMRPNWDSVKLQVMKDLIRQKFGRGHPKLALKLLQTGRATLVEDNAWGDTFWGVCRGCGENMLGKILMSVRRELTEEQNL